MKKWIHTLTAGQIKLGISGVISFLVFLILLAVHGMLGREQLSQQMAERWSEQKNVAQVSCFLSTNAYIDPDSVEMFRHNLDNALLEASITQDSPNESARLWADAYSAGGRITLTSDRGSIEANALGIGGDFFLFHPLQLLYGSYFTGNDLMQDYCVVDEDMAWQLFGSNNVAGMTVYIQNVPHIILGVVRRDSGKLNEAAGLDSTLVYVSYKTLSDLGTNKGINHYEIVMPNPISSYALNYVKENIGVADSDIEVVENTTRFELFNSFKRIILFGTRSMNSKAIIYPYWENVARGYEDILTAIAVFLLLFFLYPLILLIIGIITWWRLKSWTLGSVYVEIRDKAGRYTEYLREKHRGKKGSKDHMKEKEGM